MHVVFVEPSFPDNQKQFVRGLHAVGAVEECTDPALHNTVAAPLLAGLRDRETGRMRRLVKAAFHRTETTETA